MKPTLRNVLLLSALGGLTVGCSKKDKASEAPAEATAAAEAVAPAPEPATAEPATAEPPTAEPATAEPAAASAADLGNWDQYWPEFKKAALAKDADALRLLTQVGPGNDEIDQGTFDDLAATFLTQEVLETLAKTDAAGAGVQEEGAGTPDEVHEFSWSETAMVDGEEMGSGLFFYFKKIDGQYRLFRLLAAG